MRARKLASLALLISLAACARSGSSVTAPSPTPLGAGLIGVVNMRAIIREHPLYPQLARFDEDIAAMKLADAEPGLADDGEIGRRIAALRARLDVATKNAQAQLGATRREYAEQERAAVERALAAAGVSGVDAAA